jgi:hypothetical protein
MNQLSILLKQAKLIATKKMEIIMAKEFYNMLQELYFLRGITCSILRQMNSGTPQIHF